MHVCVQISDKESPVVKFFSLSVLCVISERSASDVFSSVSVKSNQSKGDGSNLSEKKSSTTKRYFMCFDLQHCVS